MAPVVTTVSVLDVSGGHKSKENLYFTYRCAPSIHNHIPLSTPCPEKRPTVFWP